MKLNRITSLLMLSSMSFLANSASYEVVVLPTKDLSANQFGTAIDETGLMLTTLNQPYNPPIDLTLIDLSVLALTDPDEAALGNFNDFDYNLIASFIYTLTNNRSVFGQKLSSQIGYQTNETDFSYIDAFDEVSVDTDGFTFAQRTSLGDSVNGTHIVGSMEGAYYNFPYVSEDDVDRLYTINNFNVRGFVQVGDNVVELVPEDTTAGGISSAEAINDNLQVAGTMGVGVNEALETATATCMDDDERGDIPVEVCLYGLHSANANSSSQFAAAITKRAVIWQVDNAGEVLSSTTYGLTFVPDDDVLTVMSTQATAINNDGVAIGSISVPINSTFTQAAAAFENGETIRLIEDDDLLPNVATSINDNGYIVGYQSVFVGSTVRTKMFVLNRNTEDLSFKDGFFINSSTFPRAMNNNNIVVGEGESEGGQTTRRKHGFIYDIEADTFTNVNTLIECDSEFDIVGLNDINDSNEIIGDALVSRVLRDFRGNIITSSEGEVTNIESVVAVKLVPTGEAPSDCSSTEEDTNIERQGASAGYLTLFALLMVNVFRRR